MAQDAVTTLVEGKPRRRARRPSPPRPAFFVIQVLDESGEPMHFDKKRIKIVSVERNAEKVMEITEGGDTPHVFYLRGIVPAGRGGAPTHERNQLAAAD